MVNNIPAKILLIILITFIIGGLGYLWFTVFMPYLGIGTRIIRIIIGVVGIILLYFLIKHTVNQFKKYF